MRDMAKCLPQHEHCPESQVCYVSTVPKRGGGGGSGREKGEWRESQGMLGRNTEDFNIKRFNRKIDIDGKILVSF